MKLNFEAKASVMHLSHMFHVAIFKTLLEKLRIAESEIRESLKSDTQAFHSLFY